MADEEKKAPELRFKGFLDDWEQRKFEEMLDKNDGVRRGPFGSALKKEIFVKNSDYVVYEQQNAIYDNYKTRYNITKEKFDELHKFSLKENDFIMSGAGTIGRISRVPKGIKKGVFNQALIRFRINNELTNPEYFLQFVRAENMQRKLTGANPGSAISNLVPMSEVKKWEVFVPIKAEQKKLGSFFEQLDDTIALHQRQMDNYKELKKTSMQKIFNQELRFKDKNGNDYPVWQKKKLKDLGKFYSGTGFNDKYQGYLDLSIPFFKVSDMNIASNSKYMVESNNTVDDDICREMKINKITGPAILFAKVGAAIYMERKRIVHNDFLMDNNMMALRINDSVDIEFTYYLCQSLSFSKYAQVGALPSYNASDIGRLHCKLPVISEQKKIAIFLSTLDQKVNEAAQKVELFKELKEGLMQQMFF